MLALRDAYFVPVRRFEQGNLNANAWSMRHRFPAAGIPWNSNEPSEQKRKAVQRGLEEAEAAGLVSPINTAGKTTGLHLTDAGEHRAASLASQFVLADGIGVYNAIKRRTRIGVIDVWEDDLIPSLPEWSKEWNLDRNAALVLLQDLLLPWMVRGYIAGYSTMRASVRYAIAQALPAFDAGKETDTALASDAARMIYVCTFDGERDRLKNADLIDTGEIGPIPACIGASSQAQLDGWKRSAELAAQGL